MCAITGWAGKMPTGLLYQLLHAAEFRGRDSTGIAYWNTDHDQNYLVKQATTATLFTKLNAGHVSNAQRAIRGIAHTRRASPKMPVDNDNAHPFMYESWVFAHNGVITNWKTLKKEEIAELEQAIGANPDLKHKLDYVRGANTDSMLLGPAIEELNFSRVVGCMGLVWLYGPKVYAFRSKKELTAANVVWSTPGSKEEHQLTLVASTWEIIDTALSKVENFTYDAVEHILAENTLYELTPGKVLDEGPVPVNQSNTTDVFTSQLGLSV